ncbi:hypothetical protein [Streptomyces iconiensis]|uniref:Secreted protein n=1 Tax=Streptomyces iconiensis TaxID=1384038 RepID=A0ABT7AA76_9ACTN|nr:hypothetical protein [Streptomyces iconiensis]MDJ1138245.1 hypothetical protein [Streptomyces iconiensis]
MPLTRTAKGACMAATAALALFPAAGAASASSSSGGTLLPNPARQAAPLEAPAPAGQAAPCRDLYQIGKTAYLKRNGKAIASVKHFYSPRCKRDYGYLWVWRSYTAPRYKACVGLWDAQAGKILGQHCRNNVRMLWSYPVANKGHRLVARASIREYKAGPQTHAPQANGPLADTPYANTPHSKTPSAETPYNAPR